MSSRLTSPALAGLRYYGGKSPLRQLGRWVASQLPTAEAYVEPFCGMCGILLQRSRAPLEVVNDRDERIVKWWRVVRDRPDEFARLLRDTPHSRAEYQRQVERLDHPDDLQRALAVHVVLEQGRSGLGNTGWRSHVRGKGGMGNPLAFGWDRVRQLADRMRTVTLECADACDVVEKYAQFGSVLMYVDPPYLDCDHRPYGHSEFDRARLRDLMLGAKARIAVSGYNSEWDELGWRRSQHRTRAIAAAVKTERTESLWTNFAPPQASLL